MKHRLINISCLIVAIFIGLGIIEIYLRIFNPQPIRPAMFRIDPVYGMRMIPGLSGYIKEKEYYHTFRLNSLGFRDEEPSLVNEPGTYRIIGLGDSMMWGAGVRQDETYLEQLETMLNKKETSTCYQVYNFGVTSWGTAQELACFKQQAIGYKPDLVILQYYKGNDLQDNVYTRRFRLDAQGNLIYGNYGRKRISAIKKITEKIPFYYFITQHSHLASLVRLRLLSKVEKNDEQDINKDYNGDYLDYGLMLTRALLTEFFVFSEANNIKLMMLLVPDRLEIAEGGQLISAEKKNQYARETEMIKKLCREHSIDLVDLAKSFNNEDIFSVYYKKDCHFTAYGNWIVAQELNKIIK